MKFVHQQDNLGTQLLSEEILLRDVIDLEATFGNQMGEDGEVDEPVVAATTTGTEEKTEESPELDADGNPIAKEDDDDEDEQANMSLAAMEAALKPQVLETLDIIADDYAKLSEMQDSRISATLNEDDSFSQGDEDI
ncbi:MAG: RNA polymerase sigma factor RpoD, partial [Pseudomonadota bacterium]